MKKTVVGFLSRQHGFDVLKALADSKAYQLLCVYTHALNPKSQDPFRSVRSDYKQFINTCKEKKIPLFAIDSKNQEISNIPECDFIVEVSWRYLISKEITNKARIAAFGIHRGKLPDYAGAEPIKQALSKGEKEIVITAHYLDAEIDAGGTIIAMSHPVNYDFKQDMEQNIQRLRDEITPLFSKIAFKAFDILSK
jgi:methionyl-tRNA formyltransferase